MLQNTLYCLIKDSVRLTLFFYKLSHFNAFALRFIPSTEKMKWKPKMLNIKNWDSICYATHAMLALMSTEKHMLTFC
jgi:hypothetical protein